MILYSTIIQYVYDFCTETWKKVQSLDALKILLFLILEHHTTDAYVFAGYVCLL